MIYFNERIKIKDKPCHFKSKKILVNETQKKNILIKILRFWISEKQFQMNPDNICSQSRSKFLFYIQFSGLTRVPLIWSLSMGLYFKFFVQLWAQ